MKHLLLLPLVLVIGGCSQQSSAPNTFYIGRGNDGINEMALNRLAQEVAKDAQAKRFVIQWGLVSKMSGKVSDMEMTYDRRIHTLTCGATRLTNVTDKGIHMVAAKHGDIRGLWLYGGATYGSSLREIP